MPNRSTAQACKNLLAFLGLCTVLAGCQTGPRPYAQMPNPLPREYNLSTLPPYVIEPPDVLLIDGISLIPKPPYRIRPLEGLTIRLINDVLPRLKIDGTFTVDLDGSVDLGTFYGRAQVAGLTIEEATEVITKQIAKIIDDPKVYVALATPRTAPQISGEHLVGQDGRVDLGPYGGVWVAGLNLKEAKEAIELHLSQFLLNPELSISVAGYNSKFFYVIHEAGGGTGLAMSKVPITGRETVLDALIDTGGLPGNASTRNIYIARPTPDNRGCEQILPVDIVAITKRARPETNYQLLPGDRL